MSDDITDATIAMLRRGIEEAEQKIRQLRAAINTICTEAGRPPLYAEAMLMAGTDARLNRIQDDTFYGKKQTPAMREYLEMRKAQGAGPAKPRDIYEGLKSGGYQFDAKAEEVALVGIRALLRTQPHIFHRLPQGTYGLTAWYPDAKRQKLGDDGSEPKAKKTKSRKKRARSEKNRNPGKQPSPAKQKTAKPTLALIEVPKDQLASAA